MCSVTWQGSRKPPTDEADERGRQVRERVVVVREEAVPDTCAPFIEPRDQIIDTLVVESETWASASGSRPWWSPQIGVGFFTGHCAGQRPCADTGLALS
jgi:hypothetical protein